jgi:hypothetical protein
MDFGLELIQWLKDGRHIAINCMEGLHRSLHFAVILSSLMKYLQGSPDDVK